MQVALNIAWKLDPMANLTTKSALLCIPMFANEFRALVWVHFEALFALATALAQAEVGVIEYFLN